jgi:hypothetical protein
MEMMNYGGGEVADLRRVVYNAVGEMVAVLRWLGVSKYIGIFTKVAPFDLAQALSGGTGARYEQAPPVLALLTLLGFPLQP